MDYERVDQLLWSPFPHTGLKWIFGSLAHSRLETLDIKIEIAPILDYSRLTHRSPTTSFQSVAELNASITFDRNKITFQTTKSWKRFSSSYSSSPPPHTLLAALVTILFLFCMRVRSQRNDKSDTNCITTFTYFFVKGIFTFGFSHRMAIESVDRRLLVVVKRVEIVTRSVHALVQCCQRRDHFIHFHLSPRNRFSLEINLLSSFIGFSRGERPLVSIDCSLNETWLRSKHHLYFAIWQTISEKLSMSLQTAESKIFPFYHLKFSKSLLQRSSWSREASRTSISPICSHD